MGSANIHYVLKCGIGVLGNNLLYELFITNSHKKYHFYLCLLADVRISRAYVNFLCNRLKAYIVVVKRFTVLLLACKKISAAKSFISLVPEVVL